VSERGDHKRSYEKGENAKDGGSHGKSLADTTDGARPGNISPARQPPPRVVAQASPNAEWALALGGPETP
jgi:hypothetical protein